MELFAKNGYEATTVADIAERAGLTERTYFRQFADKREVLFGDPSGFSAGFTDAIAGAPPEDSPQAALRAGLLAGCAMFVDGHEQARKRQRIITANQALRERDLLKRESLTRAFAQALATRGMDDLRARLLADLGVAAFYAAYARWVATAEYRDLGDLTLSVLDEIKNVAGE